MSKFTDKMGHTVIGMRLTLLVLSQITPLNTVLGEIRKTPVYSPALYISKME